MMKSSLWRELLHGASWAVLYALVGSLLLALLAVLHFADFESSFRGQPTLEGVGLTLGYVLMNGLLALFAPSFIPSVLGGALLVILIRSWITRVAWPVFAGFVLGGFIGLAATALSMWLSISIFLWAVPENPQPYLPFIVAACIIGTVAGGLVGRKLARVYKRT